MLDRIKYPYLSLMIGQLVLKQSISWELMENYMQELHPFTENEDFYKLLGMTTYYALKAIGGCPSVNNIDNRKFVLGEISNACEDQIEKIESLDSYDESVEQEPNGIFRIIVKSKNANHTKE